ncbi:MAG: hypothetical protein AAGF74_01285 [Pseudomonadota bacterium]
MKTIKKLALAAAATVAAASMGHAQGAIKFGSAGGWNVYQNVARGGACYAEKVLPGGEIFQVGELDAGRNFGFLALYSPQNLGFGNGDIGTAEFLVGDTVYGGKAFGVDTTGGNGANYNGGFIIADNPSFGDGLTSNTRMAVFTGRIDGGVVVPLDGIEAAAQTIQSCIGSRGG